MPWLILPSANLALRWEAYESHVDFWVYNTCRDDTNTWYIGDDYLPLSNYADAHHVLDGHVKWDGCINWQTNPNCLMHGCGPSHVDDLTHVFQSIYHIAKRYFDLLGDPVPELPDGAILC